MTLPIAEHELTKPGVRTIERHRPTASRKDARQLRLRAVPMISKAQVMATTVGRITTTVGTHKCFGEK